MALLSSVGSVTEQGTVYAQLRDTVQLNDVHIVLKISLLDLLVEKKGQPAGLVCEWSKEPDPSGYFGPRNIVTVSGEALVDETYLVRSQRVTTRKGNRRTKTVDLKFRLFQNSELVELSYVQYQRDYRFAPWPPPETKLEEEGKEVKADLEEKA